MSSILFKNLDVIYFFYGLAFLTLGMILLTQIRAAGKSKYKLLDILFLLALFALIHSVNEFIDMFNIIKGDLSYLNTTSIIFLFLSYSFLYYFGYILMNISGKKIGIWLPAVTIILFLALPLFVEPTSFKVWNVSARYFIGFSGSILSFAGLYFYHEKQFDKLKPVKKYLFISSVSFGLYGVFGGLIVPKAGFFPASIINNESFIALVGLPPQLFRAITTVFITWSMWHVINIFNLEKQAKHISDFKSLKSEITEKKIAEEELKKSVEKLKLTLEDTVHVLSSIVETKDSYTAEHQRRVAQLATSIAKETGFSQNQIEGIYVSAILHDIGKLFIPSEILNKPNKLTDLEFSLIKTHCQSGYDILKSVNFPWPIDKIICQHHERIDGSGYPHGLTGKSIMLEAKIIAVADVVEAISSHRPYRPALGLDAALKEIYQNSGILYDKKIVDTCLELFTKKKFRFDKDKDKLIKLKVISNTFR